MSNKPQPARRGRITREWLETYLAMRKQEIERKPGYDFRDEIVALNELLLIREYFGLERESVENFERRGPGGRKL